MGEKRKSFHLLSVHLLQRTDLFIFHFWPFISFDVWMGSSNYFHLRKFGLIASWTKMTAQFSILFPWQLLKFYYFSKYLCNFFYDQMLSHYISPRCVYSIGRQSFILTNCQRTLELSVSLLNWTKTIPWRLKVSRVSVGVCIRMLVRMKIVLLLKILVVYIVFGDALISMVNY